MANDELSVTFAALADPTRRAMLQRLSLGPATVKELSEPFGLTGPAISKHLRVLESAGLISTSRDGQTRPRSLSPAAFEPAHLWTENLRRTWETRHDALATYLMELQEKDTS